MKKLVVFQLGHEQYALDVNQIQSIERVMEITPVPQVENDYIKGIINLRGEVIPIIDLKENLNMGATEINKETRIIVTHFHEMSLGLLVDSASDVIDVDKTTIEASEQIIQDSKHHVIQGIVKQNEDLIILLDVRGVVGNRNISKLKDIAQNKHSNVVRDVEYEG